MRVSVLTALCLVFIGSLFTTAQAQRPEPPPSPAPPRPEVPPLPVDLPPISTTSLPDPNRGVRVIGTVPVSDQTPFPRKKGEAEYPYVSKVQVRSDGYLAINVQGNFNTSHGCQERSWALSRATVADDTTKAQLSIALSSFLGRKKVYVYTHGCSRETRSHADEGYPVLEGLQVRLE
jgi:hypothetical protein